MVPHRPALHDPRALRLAGPRRRAPDRLRGPRGRPTGRVLRGDLLADPAGNPQIGLRVSAGRDAELHGGVEQFRAGDRGGGGDVWRRE